MELSILIPTFRRPESINRCLQSLAEQSLPTGTQVLIGIDELGDTSPEPEIPCSIRAQCSVQRFPHSGIVGVRSALMERAEGRILLWLNDDVVTQAGHVEAHLRAHTDPVPRVVSGRSDWAAIEKPTLFDSIVQRTDLIFFARPRGQDLVPIGYRDCFGLNLSFPRALAEQAGGLAEVSEQYGYEDIDLAWRLREHGAECVYEPKAEVIHAHRYTPKAVIEREYRLGRAAWCFARESSGMMFETLGYQLTNDSTLDYFRASVEFERRDAVRVYRSFMRLDTFDAMGAPKELLQSFAESWILLKRYLWRCGVLDACDGRSGRHWEPNDFHLDLPAPCAGVT